MLEAALLRYLAVAHFGRGRGDWAQGESPAHWREVIQRSLATQRERFAALWRERDGPGGEAVAEGESERLMAEALEPIIAQAARAALSTLYPTAPALGESAQTASRASQ
jgi:hypothetical protein